MTKVRAVRLFALLGAATFTVAYCGFVLAGLNGGRWGLEELWKTVVFARVEVVLAWAFFASCGAGAYFARDKIGDRLFIVAVALVGLPFCWAAGLRFLYYDQPRGIFPGFEDELWRWLVNHIYAEFSFGMMIGFLGLAAATMAHAKQAVTR